MPSFLSCFRGDAEAKSVTAADPDGVYVYRGLKKGKEIRVIELSPGDEDDDLHGRILHVALKPKMEYSAISYVWGSNEKPCQLATNEGSIPITRSLAAALRRARWETKAVVVWADAVCINQNDNAEKAIQVQMMGKIYTNAKAVTGYLGEYADKCDLAIETLIGFSRSKLRPDLNPGYYGLYPKEWRNGNFPIGTLWMRASDEEKWEAVRLLMARPWFRRVWIAQEFLLNGQLVLVCGNLQIHWTLLTAAIESTVGDEGVLKWASDRTTPWHAFNDPSFQGCLSVMQLSRLKWAKINGDAQPTDLHNLVWSLRGSLATDSRDHFYGLLGFARDGNRKEFIPDYDELIEKTLRRFAAHFVKSGHLLYMLPRAGLGPQSTRFPSWVPDWTCECTQAAYFSTASTKDAESTQKADPRALAARYDLQSDRLFLRANFIDELLHLTKRHQDVTQLQTMDEISRVSKAIELEATSITLQLGGTYPTGEDVTSVMHSTLLSSHADPRFKDELDYNYMYELITHIGIETGDRSERWDDIEPVRALRYRAMHFLSTRRFCGTKGGYIGLVPRNAEVGDVVAVLPGSPLPFILRKCDEEKDTFELVGECSITGLMQRVDIKKDQSYKQIALR